MRSNLICGIDIGSSNLHGVVASFNPDTKNTEVLASHTTPSKGLRKGVVVEIKEAREGLEEMLSMLEKKSAVDIKKAICSTSGSHITSKVSKGVIAVSRADEEVSQEDVNRALEAAKTISLPQNREIIHTVPRLYSCDKQQKVANPVGMKGVRLEVNALVIEAFSPFIKNLEKIFDGLGVKIEQIVFAPLACAKATLSKRQKELGVVLLDIGGQTTGLSVFEEGRILHSAVLPVGSAHITNDLAIGFQIPVEIAEKIKLKWAKPLIREEEKKRETYSLKKINPQYKDKIQLSEIVDITEARVREILKLVRKELRKINKDKKLPAGAVLVGEGSKLKNIVPYTKKELGLPSQVGQPYKIEGLTDEVNEPGFATAIGLCLWKKRQVAPPASEFFKNAVQKVKEFARSLLP